VNGNRSMFMFMYILFEVLIIHYAKAVYCIQYEVFDYIMC
jgi:hypothetical protein